MENTAQDSIEFMLIMKKAMKPYYETYEIMRT